MLFRSGLASTVTSTDIIQQACTHPSFIPLFEHHNPNKQAPASNANLAALGNSLLGLFASEFVNATYPHLPTRVLKAAVSAYVGPTTCAHIATEMGAQSLLRWNRTVSIYFQCSIQAFGLTFTVVEFAHATCCPACRRHGFHPPRADGCCIPTALVNVCSYIRAQVLLESRG